MESKIIKDPFMGEIELMKVGETSTHLMGENKVETIYSDINGNCWIDIWTSFDVVNDERPMTFLRKELLNKIIHIFNKK